MSEERHVSAVNAILKVPCGRKGDSNDVRGAPKLKKLKKGHKLAVDSLGVKAAKWGVFLRVCTVQCHPTVPAHSTHKSLVGPTSHPRAHDPARLRTPEALAINT